MQIWEKELSLMAYNPPLGVMKMVWDSIWFSFRLSHPVLFCLYENKQWWQARIWGWAEVMTCLRSAVQELIFPLFVCFGTSSALWLSGNGRALAHLWEVLLLPICTNQIWEQEEKAAKALKEPGYVKSSLWCKKVCLRWMRPTLTWGALRWVWPSGWGKFFPLLSALLRPHLKYYAQGCNLLFYRYKKLL